MHCASCNDYIYFIYSTLNTHCYIRQSESTIFFVYVFILVQSCKNCLLISKHQVCICRSKKTIVRQKKIRCECFTVFSVFLICFLSCKSEHICVEIT